MRAMILVLSVGFWLSGCSSSSGAIEEVKVNGSECQKRPKIGKCRAAIHKYYFNEKTKKCESFIWGGCGGVVPFDSLAECENSCR